MNESIKELIESLPNEGVDCKGREWVRCKPKSKSFIDRTGEVYGLLSVLFPVKDKKVNKTKWLCLCECKNFIVVNGGDLAKSHTRSCGCLKKSNLYHQYNKKREEMMVSVLANSRFFRLKE